MRTLLFVFASFLGVSPLAADAPAPLQRAIDAVGGDAALTRARSLTAFYIGTQDSQAIAQGYYAERSTLQRYQETVLIDIDRGRAAVRTEGINSDGSPTLWRHVATPEESWSLKVKSGTVTRGSATASAEMLERVRWRIPHLALADMRGRADSLRCTSATRCEFQTAGGNAFIVLFDATSGLPSAYEYQLATLTGRNSVARYEFKRWAQSPIGLFPTGYTLRIADKVYRDLDLLDVRTAQDLADHQWFVAPPVTAPPVSRIASLPPASTEEVAPGVWMLRNVAGYNTMFARVGDCAAVFDAPGSYPNIEGPIPNMARAPDREQIIIDKVRETTGMNVCYVIPTHHHNDHFSIGGFARAGRDDRDDLGECWSGACRGF
jgi:hypothetical protein